MVYTVVGEAAETGSGIQGECPGLVEITRAVREKKMDAVVVKNLARLMWDYIAGNSYIDFLQAEGVGLVSINDDPCVNMINVLASCFKA